MFEECRLEGNFDLTSGRQSKVFYDFDLLKPIEAAEYVEQLLKQVPEEVFQEVSFVVSPAVGGIVPGFLIAFAKKLPFVIIDKGGNTRGPQFESGSYLIVDDVVTSFQAARRVVNTLPNTKCAGLATYIFRGSYTDLEKNKDIPIFYLSRKEQETE